MFPCFALRGGLTYEKNICICDSFLFCVRRFALRRRQNAAHILERHGAPARRTSQRLGNVRAERENRGVVRGRENVGDGWRGRRLEPETSADGGFAGVPKHDCFRKRSAQKVLFRRACWRGLDCRRAEQHGVFAQRHGWREGDYRKRKQRANSLFQSGRNSANAEHGRHREKSRTRHRERLRLACVLAQKRRILVRRRSLHLCPRHRKKTQHSRRHSLHGNPRNAYGILDSARRFRKQPRLRGRKGGVRGAA